MNDHEHHTYVHENVPVLCSFTQEVVRVHGKAHPEVTRVAERFEELAAELLRHTQEEEEGLFPYIRALAATQEEGRTPERAAFDTVQEPIRAMEDGHDHASAYSWPKSVRSQATSRRPRTPAAPTAPHMPSSRSSRRTYTCTCTWRITFSSRKRLQWRPPERSRTSLY